ncbi:MAG: hypothetical protein FWC22_04925 [Treponema sp.]|nr:hypothetical protein [Treponema sp.]
MEKIVQAVKDWFLNLSSAQKRTLALACTVGFSLILTIVVLMTMQISAGEKMPQEPERLHIISPIPAGELFLPDEPDYIPGVLLEREQRSIWSEQDAFEFWQDPLKDGEGQWRDKIEAAINDLLEHIP